MKAILTQTGIIGKLQTNVIRGQFTNQILVDPSAHYVPTGGTDNDVLTWFGTGYGWQPLNIPTNAVDSVNGKTGVVVLTPDDLDDTATNHKFISATDKANWDGAVTDKHTHANKDKLDIINGGVEHFTVTMVSPDTTHVAEIDIESHDTNSHIHLNAEDSLKLQQSALPDDPNTKSALELKDGRITFDYKNLKFIAVDGAHNLGDVLTITDAGNQFAEFQPPVTGGETNTASNIGTAGVGIFDNKNGVDLQFAKINPLSSKISIVKDDVNHKIDIDVAVTKNDVGLGNVPNTDATNPANIAQDTTHRFATDTEKSTWNAKQDALAFTPVPDTRTVAGKQLNNNVTLALDDLSDVIITNPTHDQIIKYNGTEFVNADPPATGQSETGSLYFDDTASGVGGYNTLTNTPNLTTEIIDSVVVNNNTQTIENYMSGALGVTIINSGVWQFHAFASVSLTSGTTTINFNVYKRTAGGSETLLFSVATADINNTTVAEIIAQTTQPAFVVTNTDYLVVKVTATTTHNANVTVNFYHNGSAHFSHIITPLPSKELTDHINNISNPHSVTKTQVGLGNCDNTSDANKPVSTAQQNALDGKVDKSTYNANTILIATADNTPIALDVGASTIVGRKATGDIVALTASETKTILAIVRGDITDNGVTTLNPNTGDTVALNRNTYKGAIVNVPSGGTLTFTMSNMSVGDVYLLKLAYAGTSTINWFTTLKWFNTGGTAPTLSNANGKVDTFLIFCRTANNYDVHYVLDNGGL